MLTIRARTSVAGPFSCSWWRTRTNSPRLPAKDELRTIERFVGSPVLPTSLPSTFVVMRRSPLRPEVPVREPDALDVAPPELTGDASAIVFEEGSERIQLLLGQLHRQ